MGYTTPLIQSCRPVYESRLETEMFLERANYGCRGRARDMGGSVADPSWRQSGRGLTTPHAHTNLPLKPPADTAHPARHFSAGAREGRSFAQPLQLSPTRADDTK